MELLNVCQNDAVTWWQHFPFLVTQCHPCSREGPNVNGVECPEWIALVWRALCKYKMLLLHPNPTYYSLHGVEFICAESQHTWQILQKLPCPVAVQSLREAHMAVLSHMPKPHLCSTQGPHLSGWILFPHSSPQTINTVPRTTKIEENDNYQPKTSHAGFFSLTNCMRLLTWPKISNGVKARNEYVLACSAHALAFRWHPLPFLLCEQLWLRWAFTPRGAVCSSALCCRFLPSRFHSTHVLYRSFFLQGCPWHLPLTTAAVAPR